MALKLITPSLCQRESALCHCGCTHQRARRPEGQPWGHTVGWLKPPKVPRATTSAWLPAEGKPSPPAQGFFGHTSLLKPLWPYGRAWVGLSCSLLIPTMLLELQPSNKNTKLGHGAQSFHLGANPCSFGPCADAISSPTDQRNLLAVGLKAGCSTQPRLTGKADLKSKLTAKKGQERKIRFSLNPAKHKTFLTVFSLKCRPLFLHLSVLRGRTEGNRAEAAPCTGFAVALFWVTLGSR